MTPPGSAWRNEIAARVALRIGTYRPGRRAAQIRCPILFCVADRDNITPPGAALKAASAAPRAEIRRYPIQHFEVYLGKAFERAVVDQVDFLTWHLRAPRVTASPAVAGRSVLGWCLLPGSL